MDVDWSGVLAQHPAKQRAESDVRPAAVRPGTSSGTTSTRGTASVPRASAPDTRTAQTQRGSRSQSTELLYSPSSPRAHVPLAAAHTAHRAAATAPKAHKGSRSAAAHRTEEHSSAQHGAQSPDETARAELRRKLSNPTRALPTPESGDTSQQSKSRRRAREPRATPQHEALAHVDTGVNPRWSRTQHVAAPPREAKHRVYCGLNRPDPSLRVNKGELEVGTRSKCFRSGFGAALHQHITDEEAFIKKFTAPYAPLVVQKLWYKDSAPPEGYQPATLSQARQRGFGAGSATLARKLQKKLHEGSAGAGRTRTRSASTRSASPSQ